MMKLNRRLFVWQKTPNKQTYKQNKKKQNKNKNKQTNKQGRRLSNYQFLFKRTQQWIRGQTIDKQWPYQIKQNPTKTK